MAKIVLEPLDFVRLDESGAFGMVLPCGTIATLERMNDKPVCFSVDADVKSTLIELKDIPTPAQLAFYFAKSAMEIEERNSKK
jgi:hypothetical protein